VLEVAMNAHKVKGVDIRASLNYDVPVSGSTLYLIAEQQDELLGLLAKIAVMNPDDFGSDVQFEIRAVLAEYGRES